MKRKPTKPESCLAHYWIIPRPDGPTSKGVCKKCGATQEFYNVLPREKLNWTMIGIEWRELR